MLQVLYDDDKIYLGRITEGMRKKLFKGLRNWLDNKLGHIPATEKATVNFKVGGRWISKRLHDSMADLLRCFTEENFIYDKSVSQESGSDTPMEILVNIFDCLAVRYFAAAPPPTTFKYDKVKITTNPTITPYDDDLRNAMETDNEVAQILLNPANEIYWRRDPNTTYVEEEEIDFPDPVDEVDYTEAQEEEPKPRKKYGAKGASGRRPYKARTNGFFCYVLKPELAKHTKLIEALYKLQIFEDVYKLDSKGKHTPRSEYSESCFIWALQQSALFDQNTLHQMRYRIKDR
jgi:hypothetical protein